MKKPLISIITICYNEKYIEKTCTSIVKQTFQDFEWIVVDGGSTDQTTLSVLRKYKDRMAVFISEKDFGRYNAMNKGIKHAQGQWIIFMNGGDSFYNFDVLKDVFYHKKYKGIDILYGDMIRWQKTYYSIKTNPSLLNLNYLKTDSISHPSTFIQRKLFEKYGTYNEAYQIVSDWAKWIEFLKHHCTFFYLGKIISSFNLEGISSQGLTPMHKEEHQQVLDEYLSDNESDDYLDNRMVTISSHISLKTILQKKLHKFIKKMAN